MEPLNALLQSVAAAVALAQGGWSVGQWMVGWIRKQMRDARTAEVLRFLRDIGCLSEPNVRGLVTAWSKTVSITTQQREELTTLLTNLTRGARFHTTHGTPMSSYLRWERLIEQLLSNIQPRRKRGQLIGAGWQEWVLERFLGMGTYGEVWLGRNPGYPDPLGGQERKYLRQSQRAVYSA